MLNEWQQLIATARQSPELVQRKLARSKRLFFILFYFNIRRALDKAFSRVQFASPPQMEIVPLFTQDI
jgi:hypothetical protein